MPWPPPPSPRFMNYSTEATSSKFSRIIEHGQVTLNPYKRCICRIQISAMPHTKTDRCRATNCGQKTHQVQAMNRHTRGQHQEGRAPTAHVITPAISMPQTFNQVQRNFTYQNQAMNSTAWPLQGGRNKNQLLEIRPATLPGHLLVDNASKQLFRPMPE